MDWKILGVVFVSVLIAEMGGRMQLATMLHASDKEVGKWTFSSVHNWHWSLRRASVGGG